MWIWRTRNAFTLALGNINNYLAALPEETYTVTLLANGGAAPFLARKDNPQTETIQTLASKGVSFRVCANALKKAGLTPADILDGITVVPAGVVEIVRLQREGYAYIKP
ncbi:MAG: DsrE family protein [Bilophila sp.]